MTSVTDIKLPDFACIVFVTLVLGVDVRMAVEEDLNIVGLKQAPESVSVVRVFV